MSCLVHFYWRLKKLLRAKSNSININISNSLKNPASVNHSVYHHKNKR